MATESGRSMLEMLAVLAIASVVTIGGVGGYQAAMKRHQTNTILEGAAQRAIVVSQQAALDRDLDNITLGEFPTDAGRGVSFPTSPTKLNEEFFSLPITGLDEATCKQLQTMAGGALRRVDCNETNGSVTADLIYHKDLSTDAGDVNSVSTGSSESSNDSSNSQTDESASTCRAEDLILYVTEKACVQAGCHWCKYNSTCQMNECPNPNTLYFDKEACLAAGYKYHGDVGAQSGCSVIDVNCEDCHYQCSGEKTTYYVKSKEECPIEKYLNKKECEDAGFSWQCWANGFCAAIQESGPCP